MENKIKQAAIIYKTEFLLFLRDFFGFFFTLVFPAIMLILFGSIYGNAPMYPGSSLGSMDISVPAYAVMVIGVTGLMAFPLTLAECKEKKIYKRFDATPAGKKTIILAQIVVNLVMTFIGIGILLAVGKILYHIQILGTAANIFTGILFSIGCMFSMGFFFTAIGRDAKITSLLCYLFYFIMLFLSGATMPDMLFPDNVKAVSAFLPMTYAVDLMQGVFAGDSLLSHKKELLILGLLTVLLTSVAALLYRKKDWT